MTAVQRIAGLRRVVEALDIERPEVSRDSAVFGVASFAFPGDIAVNASSPRHPLSDRFVAAQALRRGERAAGLMALLAIGDPFELRVGL